MQLQAKADQVELTRMFRKWGEFSHGHPTPYYYNIVSSINIDVEDINLYSNAEMFFYKNYINSDKMYNTFINQDEHRYANALYNYSDEQWKEYSYMCNVQNLQDRVSLQEPEGDIVVAFNLSSITQSTFDNVLSKLQHIIHEVEPGDYEFEGFTFSIKAKQNIIQDKIIVNNPEIKPEHLYEVY